MGITAVPSITAVPIFTAALTAAIAELTGSAVAHHMLAMTVVPAAFPVANVATPAGQGRSAAYPVAATLAGSRLAGNPALAVVPAAAVASTVEAAVAAAAVVAVTNSFLQLALAAGVANASARISRYLSVKRGEDPAGFLICFPRPMQEMESPHHEELRFPQVHKK